MLINNRLLPGFLLLLLLSVALVLLPSGKAVAAGDSLSAIKQRGHILWGTDAEGGAPYAFPDPKNPSKLLGFEVELAEAIARELGVQIKYVQNAWDSLIPALERGDFDVAVNGIEIISERLHKVLFSRPYYVYTVQLVVRADQNGIQSLKDLAGKRVGTLSGAVSLAMLQKISGVDIKVYSGVVEPYEDLVHSRLDAVFLDTPIATYYAKPNLALKFAGEPVGEGLYGIAMRKSDTALKAELDRILDKLLRSGELKRIYEKWGLWDTTQEKLFTDGTVHSGATVHAAGKEASLVTFMPALLKGAGITMLVSAVSMGIAIILGLVLALMRLYGNGLPRGIATAYIELFRGTPLLIQLYILYYGLPNIGIALSPVAAAFLGLGMNYAAYEAELYRAGIEAIPRGQMEAALALGMTKKLALRRIIFPQAFKIAMPGITNDFIALFKDSSLVSIIAMVELTKTYSILAANTLRFFELGVIVALLYLAMSYPLALLSRRLEQHLKGKKP